MLSKEIFNIILEILSDKFVIIAYLGFLLILFLLRAIVFTPKKHNPKSPGSSLENDSSKSTSNSKEKRESDKDLIEEIDPSSGKKF